MERCTRRDFLCTALGASALALWPACNQPVAPDGVVPVVAGKAQLTFAAFPKLAAVGGGVTVATEAGVPFAVVRTAPDAAIAINAVCTHEGCTAVYEQPAMDLHCACHGSRFTLSGSVEMGPARRPLTPSYAAAVDATGITVTISV